MPSERLKMAFSRVLHIYSFMQVFCTSSQKRCLKVWIFQKFCYIYARAYACYFWSISRKLVYFPLICVKIFVQNDYIPNILKSLIY